jgi:feruloyl esterase
MTNSEFLFKGMVMKLISLKEHWRALCLIPLLFAGYSSLSSAAENTPAPSMDIVKPVKVCADLNKVSLTDIGGEGSRITSA